MRAIEDRGTALVLSGGGARGAWQAGVLSSLLEDYPDELRILSGASVGAVHAAYLAAHAGARDPVRVLLDGWRSFRLEEIVRPAPWGSIRAVAGLVGLGGGLADGLLDARALDEKIAAGIPFDAITRNIGRGRISALAVSATRVATGQCVVFVQRPEADAPPWSGNPAVDVRRVQIGLDHVRASSAIPFLLPPVTLGDSLYCDGGLRQNVPLSPALHLGAKRIVVVTAQSAARDTSMARSRLRHFAGPVFLLGKTMNAVLEESVDEDLRRLERVNEIIDAGTRRYGPRFLEAIGSDLPRGREPRRIEAVAIRPSESIGRLAAEYVRSRAFSRRVRGLHGMAFRRFVEAEGDEADFVSYLLFDGEFASQLIELGRSDAVAQRARLAALFGPSPRPLRETG